MSFGNPMLKQETKYSVQQTISIYPVLIQLARSAKNNLVHVLWAGPKEVGINFLCLKMLDSM